MDKTQEEILAKDKPISLNSTGVFYITGRGKGFSVLLPFTCADFDWLMNREIEIDGEKHTIIGVEKRAHYPPWRTGEAVSLLVKDFGKI